MWGMEEMEVVSGEGILKSQILGGGMVAWQYSNNKYGRVTAGAPVHSCNKCKSSTF